MFMTHLHRLVTRGMLAVGLIGLLCFSSRGEEAPSLSVTEFKRLHQQLQPPRDESWRLLPWHNSILEARAEAAREKKPLYLLVRSGHPLGCV
jgi:hypothetical protein